MSIPRTVADVLRKHVTLEVEGIDRMYLNVYVPALVSVLVTIILTRLRLRPTSCISAAAAHGG